MKLIVVIDQDLKTSFSDLINNFHLKIQAFFEKKEYGDNFKTILICLICWEDSSLYKLYNRRKKYNKKKDELSFDIFYDYQLLETLSNGDKTNFIISIILNELTSILKKYLAKTNLDFNFELFNSDLNDFLKSQGYNATKLIIEVKFPTPMS